MVVTEAARGIGEATSDLLADAGALVACLDMKWPAYGLIVGGGR